MELSRNDSRRDGILLEGAAWKKRSGMFGKLSGSVGVGTLWERRKLVLWTPLAGGGGSRLCYYPLSKDAVEPKNSSKGTEKQSPPRGTLHLLRESARISASYLNDASQPTPYCLSIKTTDGVTPESTKWKLCFDDRKTQMAWLVALTDCVVDSSVREYNATKLAAEADKWEHGGFHRLYEEEDGGVFEAVRGLLLGKAYKEKESKGEQEEEEKEETKKQSLLSDGENMPETSSPEITESLEETMAYDTNRTRKARSYSLFVGDSRPEEGGEEGRPGASAATVSVPAREEGYHLPPGNLFYALVIVNISLTYSYWTAASTSSLVMSWWQILVAVNVGLYMCLTPPKRKEEDEKEREETTAIEKAADVSAAAKAAEVDSLRMTNSTIGTELLREGEVPLSEVPMEMKVARVKEKDGDQKEHRVEPLSEEEMGAHVHERWAMSAPDVNLSGSWTLIVDDSFKEEYDAYLKTLGFNRIMRGVACSLISRTSEVTKQSDGGRELYLKGTNPKGAWERTLTASGYPDFETHPGRKEGKDYTHRRSSIKTADAEDVDAEAWWEKRGTVHRSWLRGGKKYGGGDFESLRYLDGEGTILVCESVFHPRDAKKKKATVTWRFQRDVDR